MIGGRVNGGRKEEVQDSGFSFPTQLMKEQA